MAITAITTSNSTKLKPTAGVKYGNRKRHHSEEHFTSTLAMRQPKTSWIRSIFRSKRHRRSLHYK